MQEKYNVTGMTFAACQARVQKSVSNLTGVQECNVNLLKNSIDDVTAMIAGQIGQLLPMDEETIAFYGAQRSPFCFRTAAFRSHRPPIF